MKENMYDKFDRLFPELKGMCCGHGDDSPEDYELELDIICDKMISKKRVRETIEELNNRNDSPDDFGPTNTYIDSEELLEELFGEKEMKLDTK